MATTDFMKTTSDAATKLYEANRDAYLTILDYTVEGGEKWLKLTKSWAEDAKGEIEGGKQSEILDTITAQMKKSQEAGQELAQSYFAAGLATMYFPYAVVDQVVRPAK
jgi:hypothetical protein